MLVFASGSILMDKGIENYGRGVRILYGKMFKDLIGLISVSHPFLKP